MARDRALSTLSLGLPSLQLARLVGFRHRVLGDMACHTMNLPYMSLKLGLPTAVIAELTTPLNEETLPEGCRITYEFAARGKLPAVTLYWYERRRPPDQLLLGQKPGGAAC